MDIISKYRAINQSTLRALNTTNSLHAVKEEPKVEYVRLKENTFVLTEKTKRVCQVVTAHDLNQYKNHFHTIRIEEDVDSWLLHLLEIDKSEGSVCF